MQKRLDLGDKLLRQIFQLRAEPGLQALASLNQLLAESRQFCPFAAMGFNQRHAEKLGPLIDQIPDVPVRKAGVIGRAGEFSGLPDLVEDPEHDNRRLRTALLVKSPNGFDLNMEHLPTSIMKSVSYITAS